MKIKREIVTPYLAFIFLVVALSGILMFFHLFDSYTNVVHEFLGLTFAFFAILHIVNNWKSVVAYKNKRQLLFPSIVILIISITFVVVGRLKGNLERDLLEKLVKSPASISLKVLGVKYSHADSIFRRNTIIVKDSLESIEEISRENQKSPEEIIELVLE